MVDVIFSALDWNEIIPLSFDALFAYGNCDALTNAARKLLTPYFDIRGLCL